ncbi:glutamate receptor ionotropic, delta-1-like [Hyalella azteca]|nr:glutamate receptor ionotropic, delta-1-like [Hyalella azteca]
MRRATGGWHIVGWIIDLLNTLEKNMNFTCSVTPSVDREFGAQRPDGSWSGIIGLVDDGQADIIVASLDNILARAAVVDFLITVDVTRFVMVMRRAYNMDAAWTNYTSEFSAEVWVALAALLCCSPDETRRPSYLEICSVVIAALAARGCNCSTTSISGRMAWITTLCCAVLVSAHYNSALYSILTLNKPYYPFDGFQSLLDHGGYTLGVITGGTSLETELEENIDTTAHRAWNELAKPRGLVTSPAEGLRKAREENYVLLISETEFYGTSNDECDYTVLPGSFFKFPSGFAVKKGSALGPLFNKALLEIINTGVLPRIKRYWNIPKPDCRHLGVSAMTNKQMMSAFCFLVLGLSLAAIITGCERLLRKIHK